MSHRARRIRAAALAAALAWGLAGGCSGSRPRTDPALDGRDAPSGKSGQRRLRAGALTRETAALRARQVSGVSYVLWFGLDESHDDYQGRAVISFQHREKPRDIGQDLLLDFDEGWIRSLSLNGKAIAEPMAPPRYDGQRIRFRPSELQQGANRIEVSFSRAFATTGSGLHRFKDPADGRVYVYSDFEPYDANKVFPCFDQPDLKASFELTVEVPEQWVVVSNTLERDVSRVDGRESWAFPPSPVFSTYVFAIHAGPYQMWKADAAGVPIRLFSRKSLARHVDPPEWLEITRRGLAYFQEQFGYPYPYSKYDQLIVPEFNEGAMENVAAVTFSEDYVFRDRVTQDRRRERAGVILHEMAHMWFGNLVTMRWWNGLWLNESFATFAAAGAVDAATRFKGAWQQFFASSKIWAYWEDQLPTTHPVDVSVADTDQAFANFDGITYGKGAAALRQLSHYLGDDDFREGLQRYFMRFALRNTTLADFMRVMTEASGKNLDEWRKSWLQTPGLNTVRAEWACDGGEPGSRARISSFRLIQSGTPLRTHQARVALYGQDRQGRPELSRPKVLSVTYSGATQAVEEAVGLPCPGWVFPNHDDLDYVKVELDAKSLEAVGANLGRIPDPLARQMLWHALWDRVLDARFPPARFAALAFRQAASERDDQILARVLRRLHSPYAAAPSVARYLEGEERAKFLAALERWTREKAEQSAPGSDIQLTAFDSWAGVVRSPAGLAWARELLQEKRRIPGLRIDQERRWALVKALARGGTPDARELIAAEAGRDATDAGERSAIAAEAMIPDAAARAAWIRRIVRVDESPLKDIQLREALSGTALVGQEELIRAHVDAYFEALPRLSASADDEFLEAVSSELYPALCDPAVIARAGKFLDSTPGLPPTVLKNVRINAHEDLRCLRVRVAARGLAAEEADRLVEWQRKNPGEPAPAPSPRPSPSGAPWKPFE